MSTRPQSLILGLGIFILSFTFAVVPQPNTFKQWLCRILGIDPKVYDKISKVRGADGGHGMSLVRLNLLSGQEQTLWRCNGCWSPSAAGEDNIVVIKQDGIWLLSLTRHDEATLKVAGTDLTVILGQMSGQTQALLVLQRTGNSHIPGDCNLRLRVANLRSGTLQDPLDQPQPCVRLAEVIKVDRIRANQEIRESRPDPQTGNRSLLKAVIAENDNRPLVFSNLFGGRDSVDRFDPIWLDDQTIAYLTIP